MTDDNTILKTSLEVYRMRRPGRLLEKIMNSLEEIIKPGITTLTIAEACSSFIKDGKAFSSSYKFGGFPAEICTSVNNVAVHGIPGGMVLENGDLVTVDISLHIDGWHGDCAETFIAGDPSPDAVRLKTAAWEATKAGINAARAGNRMGDIGWAIESTAKRWGCSVIEMFAGHGIGVKLHEDPLILSTGKKNTGVPLVPGMVFTIEPVLSLGNGKVKSLGNGWSYITEDGSLSAQFEHTVALFGKRTEVLTKSNLTFCF